MQNEQRKTLNSIDNSRESENWAWKRRQSEAKYKTFELYLVHIKYLFMYTHRHVTQTQIHIIN